MTDLRKEKILKILAIYIVILLFVPLFQKEFNIFKDRPLKGSFSIVNDTVFSLKTWFSGDYQDVKEKFINQNYGFRNFFIRYNNQIAFSFYNKVFANGVIVGKKNYLYEYNYIKAYNGDDYVGDDSIKKIVKRISLISDTLNKLNKSLIIFFAPGKGSYYPEYIPDSLIKYTGKSNIKTYQNEIKDKKIKVIDFHKWFIDNKKKPPFPLYPKYGIHWSVRSNFFVADSLVKYIEKIRKKELQHIVFDKVNKKNAIDVDCDIADGLNLLFDINGDIMEYPEYHLEPKNKKDSVTMVVIADSFYWTIFGKGLSNIFGKNEFWYYNQQAYPNSPEQPKEVSQLNFADEINNHEVFIILSTDANLSNLGWGFIQNCCKYFGIK